MVPEKDTLSVSSSERSQRTLQQVDNDFEILYCYERAPWTNKNCFYGRT